MKKIILCLFAAAMLASCAPSKYEETKASDSEHMKVKTENNCTLLDIFKIDYNGHSYVVFYGDRDLNSIVHDPDCTCRKKDSNEIDFGF